MYHHSSHSCDCSHSSHSPDEGLNPFAPVVLAMKIQSRHWIVYAVIEQVAPARVIAHPSVDTGEERAWCGGWMGVVFVAAVDVAPAAAVVFAVCQGHMCFGLYIHHNSMVHLGNTDCDEDEDGGALLIAMIVPVFG